jgi:hypothetical protein
VSVASSCCARNVRHGSAHTGRATYLEVEMKQIGEALGHVLEGLAAHVRATDVQQAQAVKRVRCSYAHLLNITAAVVQLPIRTTTKRACGGPHRDRCKGERTSR